MRINKLVFFVILLCGLLWGGWAAKSISAEDSLLKEGISHYRQENYEEALAVLKKARKKDPTSTLAAYYTGLTYKQIQDYEKAEIHLKDAVAFTPKIKGALLELVEVLYQLGKLKEAHRYIGIAEKENIKPAQTAFLKGLILIKEGNNLDAIEAFKKAKALDESLEQNADYQIGLAYLKEKKYKEAKGVFKEVVITDPNSDMAAYANNYMEAIVKKEKRDRPFNFTAGFAFQYDDNVILKPSGIAVVSNIADEADTREVYTVKGEYNHKFTERFRVKLQHSIYVAEQSDLGDFDVFSNNSTVAPAYYFKRAAVSVPMSYNFTMVGGEEYLSMFSVTPLCNFMLADSLMLQSFFRYQNKNFLTNSSRGNEDRDSNDVGGGTGLSWFFADNKGFINARYELNRDDTDGNNWVYLGNKFAVNILVPLFEKFKVSASGEAFLQDFENPHTVFLKERKDEVYTANCMAAYEVFEDTELQFRYTYVKDHSNIAVYDYDRNIFSGGVEYKF